MSMPISLSRAPKSVQDAPSSTGTSHDISGLIDLQALAARSAGPRPVRITPPRPSPARETPRVVPRPSTLSQALRASLPPPVAPPPPPQVPAISGGASRLPRTAVAIALVAGGAFAAGLVVNRSARTPDAPPPRAARLTREVPASGPRIQPLPAPAVARADLAAGTGATGQPPPVTSPATARAELANGLGASRQAQPETAAADRAGTDPADPAASPADDAVVGVTVEEGTTAVRASASARAPLPPPAHVHDEVLRASPHGARAPLSRAGAGAPTPGATPRRLALAEPAATTDDDPYDREAAGAGNRDVPQKPSAARPADVQLARVTGATRGADADLAKAAGAAKAPTARAASTGGDELGSLLEKSLKGAGGPAAEAKAAAPAEARRPLSREQIADVMARLQAQAQDCGAGPLDPGAALLSIDVHPTGRVKTVKVGAPYQGTEIGACVEALVKAARFPASSGIRFDYRLPVR